MNKTIGLFGVALHSTNYGVTALGISQIAMLESIAEEIGCTFKYIVFSGELKKETDCIKNYIPVEKVEFVDIVRIKTGFKGIQSLKKNIQKCDAIIDLTYGDSFSDIYGMKNFVLYSVPKIITEKLHIPLILGPQTYGPFKSKMAEFIEILGDNYSGFTIFGQVNDSLAAQKFSSGGSTDNSDVSEEIKNFQKSNENILRISKSDCESEFGKEPVIGDKVKLGNKEYTISIIDENVAYINIPYNTIPDDFIISYIWVYTVEPCTPKESAEISEKIKELFQTEYFDPPEPRVLDEVQNIQLAYGITAAVIIMIILNISRVYSYVLTYRKKPFAIMNICGASKRKIFLIYLVELMLTLIVTFGIALLIFHTLILQPIAVSYPNFLISMTLQTYLIIFGIYFVIAVLIMSLTISRFISKSAVEMERSGD